MAAPAQAPVARSGRSESASQDAATRRDATKADPNAWIAQIVALRTAGREDEADRELQAFRRRYPDFTIPPNALKADDTR
jgi:hypothetical protein